MKKKEEIESLLQKMVEVKDYKYRISVCTSILCEENIKEVIDAANALTGKHFRLPTKEEMRYIISEASEVADKLWISDYYIYEACQINGHEVLIDPRTGKLANTVYSDPWRGQSYCQPTPCCYRLVESDFVPENTEDPEYDELLKRKEQDQAYQDYLDELRAGFDH